MTQACDRMTLLFNDRLIYFVCRMVYVALQANTRVLLLSGL